jgi:AraC family transcriptional regulator
MEAQIARTDALAASRPWRMIHDEQKWIDSPSAYGARQDPEQILVSRWTGATAQPRENVSETDGSYHVIGISVRAMNLTVFASQRLIHDGRMAAGMIQINRPAQSLRAIFRSCYDVLHLHIPNGLIGEILQGNPQAAPASDVFGDPAPFRDPIVKGLAHALIRAEDCGGPLGPTYADSIGLAITAKLIARQAALSSRPSRPTVAALTRWRLKRVVDYVDSHLADPIGLTDLAASSGLSRMHFAAQFRAATGLRPHEYLLRRRIERAQTLLLASRLPLCEVALDVGFKSQAHFSTIFARFVGETPNVWRRRNYGVAVAGTAPEICTPNFRTDPRPRAALCPAPAD